MTSEGQCSLPPESLPHDRIIDDTILTETLGLSIVSSYDGALLGAERCGGSGRLAKDCTTRVSVASPSTTRETQRAKHRGDHGAHPLVSMNSEVDSLNTTCSLINIRSPTQNTLPTVKSKPENSWSSRSGDRFRSSLVFRARANRSFLHNVEILPTQPEVIPVIDGVPNVLIGGEEHDEQTSNQVVKHDNLLDILQKPTVVERQLRPRLTEDVVRKKDKPHANCKKCGTTFRQRRDRISHGSSCVDPSSGTDSKLQYFCSSYECSASFGSHRDYIRHRQVSHVTSSQAASEWTCSKCSLPLTTSIDLRAHTRMCSGKPVRASPSKRMYVCQTCGKKCPYPSALRVHQEMHVLKYTCPVCGVAFRRFYDMTKHLRYDHVGTAQHECKDCGKVFRSGTLLFRHKSDDLCAVSPLALQPNTTSQAK